MVGGDLGGPGQSLVVVVGLGQGGHDAADADAVGAHGDHAGLAVLVQDGQSQGLGVFASQLEDVADLDAAGQVEGAGAVGGGVALTDLGGLDGAVGSEVAAHDQVQDVLLVGVGAGDPAGSLHDPGVDEVAHGAGEDLGAVLALLHAPQRGVRADGGGADVAAHELGVGLEVGVAGHLDLGGGDGGLQALHVDVAVPGHADDQQLALAAGVDEGDDDVLEGVGGRPGPPVGARVGPVAQLDQGVDGGGVGGVDHARRADPGGVHGLGDHGGDGLGVGRVAA